MGRGARERGPERGRANGLSRFLRGRVAVQQGACRCPCLNMKDWTMCTFILFYFFLFYLFVALWSLQRVCGSSFLHALTVTDVDAGLHVALSGFPSRSAPTLPSYPSPLRQHRRTPSQHREVKVSEICCFLALFPSHGHQWALTYLA